MPKALKKRPSCFKSEADKLAFIGSELGLKPETFNLNCFSLKNIYSVDNTSNIYNNKSKEKKCTPKTEKYITSEYREARAAMWRKVADCDVMQQCIKLGYTLNVLVKNCMDIGFDTVYKACVTTLRKPDQYFTHGLDVAVQRVKVLAATIRNMGKALTDKLAKAAQGEPVTELPESVAPKPVVEDESKPLADHPQWDTVLRKVKASIGRGAYMAYFNVANPGHIDREHAVLTANSMIAGQIKNRFLQPLYDALESTLGVLPRVSIQTG